MRASMNGSSISSIWPGSGSLLGLSISSTSPLRGVHLVDDARRGGEQRDIELALQPLLDDLHVQQAEKSAAEAEAERIDALGLEEERWSR